MSRPTRLCMMLFLLFAVSANVPALSAEPGRNADAGSFVGAKAGEERTVAGIKLCWCPAGRFLMGSPPSELERRPGENQVQVTLTKGFWMSKYETTQADWRRVMGALPGPVTEELPAGDELPVGNCQLRRGRSFLRQVDRNRPPRGRAIARVGLSPADRSTVGIRLPRGNDHGNVIRQ